MKGTKKYYSSIIYILKCPFSFQVYCVWYIFSYSNQQWSSMVDTNPTIGPTATPRSPHPSSSRTSPVAVPVPSRLRQRQESSGSSLSVGRYDYLFCFLFLSSDHDILLSFKPFFCCFFTSWQLISGTGSLRGSASTASNSGSITPRSVHSHGSCNADM